MNEMTVVDRFEGCILCGAIGDAWGSAHEGLDKKSKDDMFYPFGKPIEKEQSWTITDDTQLTLATIEAIVNVDRVRAKDVADEFLKLYNKRSISCLLYTSPSPRDRTRSRMPSSA